MPTITELLQATDLAPPLPEPEVNRLAGELAGISDVAPYPRSIAAAGAALFFLGQCGPVHPTGSHKVLGILGFGRPHHRCADGLFTANFHGEERYVNVGTERLKLKVCPTDHANAIALRAALPFTAPTVIGLRKSVGCGDRLGLATPGHVRAVRRHTMAPVLAQQSIREMARTERTPEQVLDAATWGVFQEGWRGGFGADADHLKTTGDIDRCVAAGFTFYTADPGDHVDPAADSDDVTVLARKVEALPWDVLETTPADLRARYLHRPFFLGTSTHIFREPGLLRAAAKYGPAVAHTATMYRHLAEQMGDRPFEFEVSVDETDSPTSVLEHAFIASELKRLGVQWVSLAPRFVGRFEKGVDYVGAPVTAPAVKGMQALARFEEDLKGHVAVARHLGPYKLSLHSGSDKFSIYPIFARLAGDLVHVKTAGTSYLEALRAVARVDSGLFRRILTYALERYGVDRATYHVSAHRDRVPSPDTLSDEELTTVLDQFDGRQVLHVTFGSVLTARDEVGACRYRDRLLGALQAHEEVYYTALEVHFERHLRPFDD